MARISPATWNVDFALVDELGALISKLRSGDNEMLVKTYI